MIGLQWDQQHAQGARALRLGLPVQVKTFACGERRGVGRGFLARGFVGAPCQGLQQLAGILKIALPQQGRAFAGQAVGAVSGQGVIGHDHAAGHGAAVFGAPAGLLRAVCTLPAKKRGVAHGFIIV